MSLPKEPRQQMINMMYLVLTAMLAMNITKEVLNAFATINSSIVSSNSSITDKNGQIYGAFDAAEQNPQQKEKAAKLNLIAKEIKAESEKLTAYLESFKDTVINASGGWEVAVNGQKTIKNLEDINAPTLFFVEKKKGNELKDKMNGFVDFLLSKVDPSEKTALKSQFPIQIGDMPVTDDNPKGDWTFGTFHNIPVIATVAMLSKFQSDVKNSEGLVLETLLKKIDAETIKFDELEAVAVPKTSYALDGQDMEARVILVAYNKTYNPQMSSSAGRIDVQNGVGTMKFKASGSGTRTVNGVITRDVNGEKKNYPFKFDYTVGSAGASLQLDKMNVMYIGVENPVTLSASGYNIEDVKLNMPWASIKSGESGKGSYLVSVTNPGTFDYSIDASGRGGSTGGKISSGKIRVKNIPSPNATVGGKMSGLIGTAIAKAQPGVVAKLEDFVFETQFKVTRFRFTMIPKVGDPISAEVNGNQFNAECETIKQRSKPGDKWLFDNVYAVGPDKKVRPINSIILTLN